MNRDSILSAADLPVVAVDCPEWGGAVHLRVITAGERDSYEDEVYRAKDKSLQGIRAKLLVRAICDDAGKRLFGDADADALSGKSSIVLERLFVAAQRHNRMAAEDVAELRKNSASVTVGASC